MVSMGFLVLLCGDSFFLVFKSWFRNRGFHSGCLRFFYFRVRFCIFENMIVIVPRECPVTRELCIACFGGCAKQLSKNNPYNKDSDIMIGKCNDIPVYIGASLLRYLKLKNNQP